MNSLNHVVMYFNILLPGAATMNKAKARVRDFLFRSCPKTNYELFRWWLRLLTNSQYGTGPTPRSRVWQPERSLPSERHSLLQQFVNIVGTKFDDELHDVLEEIELQVKSRKV